MASETAPFCVTGAAGKGAASAAHRPHGHVVLAARIHDALVFAAGAVAAVLLLLCFSSLLAPAPVPNLVAGPSLPFPTSFPQQPQEADSSDDGLYARVAAAPRTFYDDPKLSYAVDRRVAGWDAKRAEWLRLHYPFGLRARRGPGERVVMLSGSQSHPCAGDGGDHMLLRFLKNKVDYARLHGIELLYNTALLQPRMVAYWAKIPVVRAAMLAHPEAEWVWWLDADAVITDMDFAPPLATRYKEYNLVVHGWDREVYEARSWVGLNAGVFLIRNCQWSLDFMDAWASMGPASPEYARWGKTLKATLSDKPDAESDDQSALAYLLLKNPKKWGARTYLEHEYYFQGYWAEIVDRLDGVAARYRAAERRFGPALRRRHAEGEHALYAAARNAALRKKAGGVPGPDGGGQKASYWRRPFVTHFTGCNPCGGRPNEIYSNESCAEGMRRALNLADDQVLRAYGFRHAGPLKDDVRALLV
ncbi:hypothetical protein CFC21_099940 [Triticum aestivum]|uniref:Uncharacterized protein n=2 Tax=Triticum aestivum TaxID=4565 RepID=A0A3B6U9R4_WHEAT|nr:probable glycosyltransferase 6 [Triticum aestivum]KAF7098180.1 hypothetical protein CFC21_099940 [Triticum aestivum]